MRNKSAIVILLNLVLLLAYFNWSVWQKEETLAEGRLVLLKLAPVDPRSLMQGDYMRLSYAISQVPDPEKLPARGYVVVRIDENGIGQLVRYQEGATPLQEGEQLIRYSKGDWTLNIGAESYFFEEGQGEQFAQAEFGGLKVDDKGNSILVGLYDASHQMIKAKRVAK
jgi:uncharacterized membrane-anchored protein